MLMLAATLDLNRASTALASVSSPKLVELTDEILFGDVCAGGHQVLLEPGRQKLQEHPDLLGGAERLAT
jgi:hypothetical protein